MKISGYMDLLKCIADRTAPSEKVIKSISLQELYDFSALNKLLPLTAELLPYWKGKTEEEKLLEEEWKAEAMQLIFKEHKKLHLVKLLLAEAEKRKLPLIFFKGYLLAELYKSFALRNSSDTDILVREEDAERAMLMLKELNYQPASELDTEHVYTFIYQEEGLTVHKIELHTSLYEDASRAELKLLNQWQLTAPEQIHTVACCGMKLQTLHPTGHLIYQMFHMVKHLCCHGFPARYLLDTALFIRRYGKEIDWLSVKASMEQLGYSKFYARILSALSCYFGFPEEVFPAGASMCSREETEELVRDILGFGARSYGEELSGAFFYFEAYIEKLERKDGKRLKQITYDGTTVPVKVVPMQYQQSEKLKNRIQLLRDLELI